MAARTGQIFPGKLHDYENHKKNPKATERSWAAVYWLHDVSARTVGPNYCRLSAFKPLAISTYNVGTLFQQGKIHQLFVGCADTGVDIIGLREHRSITNNPTEELWSDDKNWVIVYSFTTQGRQGGVGLPMSRHNYRCLQRVDAITERITSATFHGNPKLSITVVYAPTDCSSSSVQGDFYNSLKDHLD